MSICTSTEPAERFSPPSVHSTSCGTSVSRGSKPISASGLDVRVGLLRVRAVLWRTREAWPLRNLIFPASYLGGDTPSFQINFSRPGGQIIAQVLQLRPVGYDAVQALPHDALRHAGQFLSHRNRESSARSSCSATAT